MKNLKPLLTVLEHIALIAILSGAVGFYLGSSYGSTHATVKALSAAPAPLK